MPDDSLVNSAAASPQTGPTLPQTLPSESMSAATVDTTVPENLDLNADNNSKGNNKKKIVIALVALIVLIGGAGSAIFLASKNQSNPVSARDCTKYTFNVTRTGVVSVTNATAQSEPGQKANVTINGQLVDTLNVPALQPGDNATLGNVDVSGTAAFTWSVVGSLDCANSGAYTEVSYQCTGIKAFDTTWNQLSTSQLSQLKSGTIVRFTVGGTASSGELDKARFTINGVQMPEVSTKKPNTDEFYYEYTIPANTTSFTVNAQLHNQQQNFWF